MPVIWLAVLLQTTLRANGSVVEAPRLALAAVEADTVVQAERAWRRSVSAPAARLGLAYLALHTYRYPLADSGFRSLLTDDPAGEAASWARIGLSLSAWARGDFLSADALFREAVAMARIRGDTAAEREGLLTWASVRIRRAGTPTPLELLARFDSITTEPTLELGIRRRCVDGQVRSGLGFGIDVTPLYRSADSAASAGLKRLGAACLFGAGTMLATRGFADSAAAWLGRAARWQREAHDRVGLAASLQWLGFLQLTIGRYPESGTALREAIVEGASVGSDAVVGWAYLSLARLALALRDGASSSGYAAAAESLFARHGDRWGQAMVAEVEASRALQLHDPVRARPVVERYHRAVEGRNVDRAWSHRDLGRLAIQERNWGGAERQFDSAAALVRANGLAGLWISLIGDRAHLALARGQPARAESLFRARVAATTPAQVVFRAGSTIELAELEVQLGRPAVAESLARAAVDELERYRAGLSDRELRMQVFDLDTGLDPAPGLAAVIAGLARAGRIEAAFELAERRRARKLLDALVLASAVGDTVASTIVRSASPSSADIARALARLTADSTAVIEFVRGDPRDPTVAFLATGAGLTAIEVDSAGRVAVTLDRYLALLGDGATGEVLASELGADLIGPVLSHLPAGTRRLLVIPDGELYRVPFDALRFRNGDYLVSRFAVTLAPSVAVAARLRARPPATGPVRVLAFGDPELGEPAARGDSPLRAAFLSAGGLPRLPATRGEAREAVRFGQDGIVRLGRRASEGYLRTADLTPYRVLHLGTHALVDEHTVARTGLALSGGDGQDGFVTPGDLARLKLRADLVVLSGCRTAAGVVRGGEGVQGLAAPMLEAGARAVLATAWPVHDRAARDFVARFYREAARGSALGDALRETKLGAAAAGHPVSEWAAFELIGDPDTVIPLTVPGRLLGPRLALAIGILIGVGLLLYGVVGARRRVSDRS